MRSIIVLLLAGLCGASCRDRALENPKDTSISVHPAKAAVGASDTPEKLDFITRATLDASAYTISYVAVYSFPAGRLIHDSDFYFKTNYLIVTGKSGKTSDSIKVNTEDLSNCRSCTVHLKDLTDTLGGRPLFLQLVTPGEDLTSNIFIGYRDGRLQELFHLGDTDDDGVDLHLVDGYALHGVTWGIDEVVGAVEHNFPVRIDMRTMQVSHPLPDTQYIGYKTAATAGFRAYRLMRIQPEDSLMDVKIGDSVFVDTFYRARQKVGLLVHDSVRVEVKLVTARKKLWHPAAPG